MAEKPTITPRENGPLLVKNLQHLVLPGGQAAETKQVLALCRCGQSSNKPFCDGSHNDAGFDGSSPSAPPDGRDFAYEGGGVIVTFNKHLCSHAAECGKRLPAVFDVSQKPWVQPDKGTAEQIAAVVAACPSGALRMSTDGGDTQHKVGEAARITVDTDGPYRVENVALDDAAFADGQSMAKFVLCRCGHSKNKPFCDGSHGAAGWTSDD